MRPPDSWSIVAAVIAVIAALRPGIWKIAGSELDPCGLAGQPGEDRGCVRPVGLGGPDRVVAELLGGLHGRELLVGTTPEPPVADVQTELHRRSAY